MGELVVVEPGGRAVAQAWQPAPSQADSDDHLVTLWLHGRIARTLASYTTEVRAFRAFIGGRRLRAVRLGDLHAYVDSMAHLAASSRCTRMGAIKSLLSFGFRVGYLPVNVGAAVRLPAPRCALAERIMTEAETHRLLAAPNIPRNRAMLHLIYAAGLRVSEVAGLRWRDLTARDGAGQAAIYGKGGRTRVILLPASTWLLVQGVRGEAEPDDPVFRSREGGGRLHAVSIQRIVKATAMRAGLRPEVSTHWLRHAHASHSLDRGAPISLVQATLGHASVATTGRYLQARPGDSSARYLGL